MKLQIFNHPRFGKVEVAIIDGKEMFGATQTALALGYTNPHDAITKHCRPDGVAFREVIDSLGRRQQMKFIDEGNLYRLIVKSRLPDAEKFERYVFEEILPSIRKHGAYMTPETIEKTLSDPDFIIGLATKLKEANEEKQRLQAKIEADKPKVLFAESLQVSDDTINVNDLAKLLKQNGIDIGEVRLFKWLRDNGYLIKSGSEYNMPTQKSMNLGLFEVKIGTRQSSDGTPRMTRTPKVTGKGQMYFINKFRQMYKGA
jgi:phage antirepressor YoqD-like protein